MHDWQFGILNLKLDRLLRIGAYEMKEFDDLIAEVTKQGDVITSMETFIAGLPAYLASLGISPAQVQKVAADLSANTDRITKAVVAGTVAENPPTA